MCIQHVFIMGLLVLIVKRFFTQIATLFNPVYALSCSLSCFWPRSWSKNKTSILILIHKHTHRLSTAESSGRNWWTCEDKAKSVWGAHQAFAVAMLVVVIVGGDGGSVAMETVQSAHLYGYALSSPVGIMWPLPSSVKLDGMHSHGKGGKSR